MTSQEIRSAFLDFFREKEHQIVPSAPMVLKNDPTLMFTNAGMNQFKDFFLGTRKPTSTRIADTQKCLRVTGKHNDLEEVGHDTYHHTMFEMLGNWSFGDYFKEEAIGWAWEFLTKKMKLDPGRIYATIFKGDPSDGVERDEEAFRFWEKYLPGDRILDGSKKDNFWEMGETGPCGPCSEIHLDMRPEEERKKKPGAELVNRGDPLVIEIWNLVFIQFNRRKSGELENLPARHVDTGMGFERLCMALQQKTSSYDTDLFRPIIAGIERRTGIAYGQNSPGEGGGSGGPGEEGGSGGPGASDTAGTNGSAGAGEPPGAEGHASGSGAAGEEGGSGAAGASDTAAGATAHSDVAMRVVADHLRAIAFSIADGQLPSNNKAGYVIRRILRRAVRYGYTYLGQKEPFIHELVPDLVEIMGGTFPELDSQKELIQSVIREEEQSFLVTLENGIRMLDQLVEKAKKEKYRVIPGRDAFVLYDTYGFPLDLTELILAEEGLEVDRGEFQLEMEAQKTRSKKAAESESGDWTVLADDDTEEFVGYDWLSAEVQITRFRKVSAKGKDLYHLVFNITPFYAESGGQIGDRGYIENDNERVEIIDTLKENELIIHVAKKLPSDPTAAFNAQVNEGRRVRTANNHTATHLMHHALREVLGNHVEQKGSLVDPDYLRFDFSHFQKVTDEELREVEHRVNQMIRANTTVKEQRAVPMSKAQEMGAIALFGEKYGDTVRVIQFGDSVELCGGTHVKATGQIGLFKIFRESSIAAGVRRIEALTGEGAERYVDEHLDIVKQIAETFEKQKDLVRAVRSTVEENSKLSKQVDRFQQNMIAIQAKNLQDQLEKAGDAVVLVTLVELDEPGQLRDLSFRLRSQYRKGCLALGAEIGGKAHLAIAFGEEAMQQFDLNASVIVREAAKAIRGGGGGQPFFATAGGKNPEGLQKALDVARKLILEKVG